LIDDKEAYLRIRK